MNRPDSHPAPEPFTDAPSTGAGGTFEGAASAEQVPCGAAAKKALDAAQVKLTPVTL